MNEYRCVICGRTAKFTDDRTGELLCERCALVNGDLNKQYENKRKKQGT